jgi:hemolysin type calcium-binding protein
MSDTEIPNIVFANELALTVNHDVLDGGPGNTKFIASVNTINTLGQNDFLTGGGGDNMLSLAAAGAFPSAVNFETDGIGTFEIKNAAFDQGSPSELWVNMIDVIGLETLWLRNNTGDSVFDNAQNLFSVVIQGGGYQGQQFHTDINFDPSVATGPDDTLELLVSGTRADVDINDYPTAPDVENLWLQVTGGDSTLDYDAPGLNTVMGAGDANNFNFENEGGPVSSIDFTGFMGNLKLFSDVGENGGGPATVDSGKGADKLDLDGDGGYDDVIITSGKGHDTVKAHGFGDVNVDLGQNKNRALLGWNGSDVGNVTVTGADGKDVVFVDSSSKSGGLMATLGAGKNKLVMDVGGSASVDAKGGNDVLVGSVSGDLDANLRSGQNMVNVSTGNLSNLLTKNGNDTVDASVGYNIGSSGNWVDVGNGDNDVDITFGTWTGAQNWAYLRAGDGNDTLEAASGAGDELVADLGEGDNDALISGMSINSADITFGGGADEVFTAYRGLVGSDDIDFGGGNDKLYVNNLEILGFGDLGGVTAGSLENIYFKELGASGTVDFNGATSGANAAGVMNYWLDETDLNRSYNLDEMADGVTFNLPDNGNTIGMFALDLAGNSGTAYVNFMPQYFSNNAYVNHFDVSNVATLNIDSGNATYYGRELTLGNGAGFTDSTSGTDELTKVYLTGNNRIHLDNVNADALAMIDGSGMNHNIRLDLNNVAANIDIDTGSGTDYIYRDSTGTNFDIDTGLGSDYVYSGGGDDNIKLGGHNDTVYFSNTNLNDFDTVDGGTGTDSMRISGGLIGAGGAVVNDDFFFLISNMEDWFLSSSKDNLELGNTAQSSGLESMSLGNGNDKVTLKASYSKDLEVTIGNGTSNDTVDASLSGATLTVRAQDDDLTGGDMLTGGTGLFDELVIYDVNGGGPANLAGVKAFEYITVELDGDDVDIDADGDNTVAAGATLTVVTNGWSGQGNLDFWAFGETDGMLHVTGGWGDDRVATGGQNDTLVGNNGDDILYGGGGNDSILGGNQDDQLIGAGGNDVIDGGTGNDAIFGDDIVLALNPPYTPVVGIGGVDNITGGTGGDLIWGGAMADIINVGASEDLSTDTVLYLDQTESFGGSVDQVSGFTAGVLNGDKVDVSASALQIANGGQQFVGNGTSFGNAQGLVTAGDGIVDVVFQLDDEVLWVDVNDDGTLNNDDLQVHLVGVGDAGGLHDSGTGFSANLVLGEIPIPS